MNSNYAGGAIRTDCLYNQADFIQMGIQHDSWLVTVCILLTADIAHMILYGIILRQLGSYKFSGVILKTGCTEYIRKLLNTFNLIHLLYFPSFPCLP